MEPFKKGWFTELCPLWPGRALSMRVVESICDIKSEFQRIEIFRAEGFGTVLALDGRMQCAEADEFMYHEMLAHVPAFAHPEPRRALVVGGGDGGIARELLKHQSIESIEVCELDREVVEKCREFMPFTATSFDSPKVELHCKDGCEFVKSRQGRYDIIIVDAPDPVGPGEGLFGEDFLSDAKSALAPGGVLAAQSESFILHGDIAQRQQGIFSRLSKFSGYCAFPVPSYPGGSIGFCAGSDLREVKSPCREPGDLMEPSLRCYSSRYHRASFTLPAFWRDHGK